MKILGIDPKASHFVRSNPSLMLINYNSYKYCDFDFRVQSDKVANEKHPDIIKKGVTAWNEWRE